MQSRELPYRFLFSLLTLAVAAAVFASALVDADGTRGGIVTSTGRRAKGIAIVSLVLHSLVHGGAADAFVGYGFSG